MRIFNDDDCLCVNARVCVLIRNEKRTHTHAHNGRKLHTQTHTQTHTRIRADQHTRTETQGLEINQCLFRWSINVPITWADYSLKPALLLTDPLCIRSPFSKMLPTALAPTQRVTRQEWGTTFSGLKNCVYLPCRVV